MIKPIALLIASASLINFSASTAAAAQAKRTTQIAKSLSVATGAEAAPNTPVKIVAHGIWEQSNDSDYHLAAHIVVTDFASGAPLHKLGNSRGNGSQGISLPNWWGLVWFSELCALTPTKFQNKGDGVYLIWYKRQQASIYACQQAERRKFVVTMKNNSAKPMGAAFIVLPQ